MKIEPIVMKRRGVMLLFVAARFGEMLLEWLRLKRIACVTYSTSVCVWTCVRVSWMPFSSPSNKSSSAARGQICCFVSNNNNGLLIMTERPGVVAPAASTGSLELSQGQCADGQPTQNSEEAYSYGRRGRQAVPSRLGPWLVQEVLIKLQPQR